VAGGGTRSRRRTQRRAAQNAVQRGGRDRRRRTRRTRYRRPAVRSWPAARPSANIRRLHLHRPLYLRKKARTASPRPQARDGYREEVRRLSRQEEWHRSRNVPRRAPLFSDAARRHQRVAVLPPPSAPSAHGCRAYTLRDAATAAESRIERLR